MSKNKPSKASKSPSRDKNSHTTKNGDKKDSVAMRHSAKNSQAAKGKSSQSKETAKPTSNSGILFWSAMVVLATSVALCGVFFSDEIQTTAGFTYNEYISPQILSLQKMMSGDEEILSRDERNIPDADRDRDIPDHSSADSNNNNDQVAREIEEEQKRLKEEEEQKRRQEKENEERERKEREEEERIRKEKEVREREQREEKERQRKQREDEEQRKKEREEEERQKKQKEEKERQRKQKEEEERQKKQKEEEDRQKKQKEEEERKKREREEKEKQKKEEEQRQRQQREEEERQKKQKEEEEKQTRQREEEERQKKQREEEERVRKQREDEERQKKQKEEEEKVRKQREDEERRRKQKEEEERQKKQKEEEEKVRKQREDEERQRIQKEEEERQKKQKEEEVRKQREDEERQRKQKEEEERQKQQKEEEEKVRKQREDEERQRKQKEEEEKVRKQREDEERQRKQKEEEERQKKQKEEEEKVRKQREDEERQRIQKEEEERQKKQKEEEEKVKKQREDEERQRIQKEEEEERQRKQKEEEELQKQQREEEERQRIQTEEEERQKKQKEEEEQQKKQREEEEKQKREEERIMALKEKEEIERKKEEEDKKRENLKVQEEGKDLAADQASYEHATITNDEDLKISSELDKAASLFEKEDFEGAVLTYDAILAKSVSSPRAHYGKALTLDKLGFKHKSNEYLEQAINFLTRTMELADVPDELYKMAGRKLADRQQFRGWGGESVKTYRKLTRRFPEDLSLKNELGMSYMMVGQNDRAKDVFKQVLSTDPASGFAKVHMGFILKDQKGHLEEAVTLLQEGIQSEEEGTQDGRFFLHLGDSLIRLDREQEARAVYQSGEDKGLFISAWQRSLYNVEGLTSRPWWTVEQTGYKNFFQALKENWKEIREEGLAQLNTKTGAFVPEDENLRDTGDWKQFTLFQQGRKNRANCEKAPKTCALIQLYPSVETCRRGQVKFSVMSPGIHVWPHTGPTNCRIRSHLGLVVPKGPHIRVMNETRTWKEGELLIFDDSFEHEVWHEGSELRLVLIVDVWHPELTKAQRRSLSPI